MQMVLADWPHGRAHTKHLLNTVLLVAPCRQEIVMPLRSDTVEEMESNVGKVVAWVKAHGG